MIIKSVKLTNFRIHKNYRLDCLKETSLIVGENGSGKTSVLEAIYIAMQGKSFKAVDSEILRRGADFYKIELEYSDGEKIIVIFDGKKSFLVGDKKFLRLPKQKKYPIVLFEPRDLNLINASPARRRDYLDRWFGQLDEKYSNSLSKYNKALKQRNELLKRDFLREEELFSWNILLAKYGSWLIKRRKEEIDNINKKITEVYRSIAKNKDTVELKYTGGDFDESEYLKQLEKSFEKDRIMKWTTFGIQRDDFVFYFNGVEAEGSASRGEVRSIILALKFIEAEMIFERLDKKPLILLDDVFSELDEARQKSLMKNFKDNQIILTSVE